jgi:hypothetical protein
MRSEQPIERRTDDIAVPSNARSDLNAKRLVDLARGMGIPAHDAASQVMELVTIALLPRERRMAE